MKFEITQRYHNEPSEKLIADLAAVAKRLDRPTLTQEQYYKYGKYHPSTFTKRFGTWHYALEKAGLSPTRRKVNISDKDLMKNLEQVWRWLKRQPTAKEMYAPVSDYSIKTYVCRYGSWMNTLRFFVTYKNKGELPVAAIDKKRPITRTTICSTTRFNVFMRDAFKCTGCGKSPLTHPGTTLHCDHIIPIAGGGKSIMTNLQTLCAQCNLSKGGSTASQPE